MFAPDPVDSAEYQRNHKAARKHWGPATLYHCITRCGASAVDWAWKHGKDPKDPKNYKPMCRKCHQDYDRAPWLVEERKKERARIEQTSAFKGWTPERREAQRQRMLAKWSDPEERAKQSERAKRDAPWIGRRSKKGDDAR